MDQELLQRVDDLLAAKKDAELTHILMKTDADVVADIIESLEHGKRKTFVLLPPEQQADVALQLSELSRKVVLPRLPETMVARMLHFLDEDEATDILQALPQKRRDQVLQHVQVSRRKRIEKLLTFGPETAGGLMDLSFIEVDPDTTVSGVINAAQEYAKLHKQVPIVLVNTPKGMHWVPSRELISAPKQDKVTTLLEPVPGIAHSADREEVLDLMRRKENGDIVYVMDDQKHPIGIIHLNDLLRIAQAEASEDLYRMGAVGRMDASYLESNFITIWRKRVGWLSVLFIAELFTFTALARFESSIDAVTALALFVPLCLSTGGNSGSQAATLITRAMALGHVGTRDWLRVLSREFLMGIALGLALGIAAFVRATLTPQKILGVTDRWTIGLVVGLAVAMICVWGTLVGSMLPVIFKKLGFDPAYASSPFVATFVDVTGIIIYFSIANALILS